MDSVLGILTPQRIDTIMSDPYLLVGASLLILGILLFLFSAIKFIRHRSSTDFVVPHHPVEEEPSVPEKTHVENNGRPSSHPAHTSEASPPVFDTPETPEPTAEAEEEPASDRTVIMPPGVADLQAQFEIAITQIKQLNKKVFELERQIETLGSRSQAQLEPNELKEPPMDAGDFTKKLLKVVEHVIVLEKEVARLRENPASTSAKPPIMPL